MEYRAKHIANITMVIVFLGIAVVAWAAPETKDFFRDNSEFTKWLLRAAAALAIYELVKMDKNQTRLFTLHDELSKQVAGIAAVCAERTRLGDYTRRKDDDKNKLEGSE